MYDKTSKSQFDREIEEKINKVYTLSWILGLETRLTPEQEKMIIQSIEELEKEIDLKKFVITLPGFKFDESETTKNYINAWSSAFGEVSRKELEERQKSLEEKRNMAQEIMAGMTVDTDEWKVWDEYIKSINADLEITKGLIKQVDDGTLLTKKKIWDWEANLNDIPQAYSIISDSIQAMNRDMDDSIKKIFDMGEGLVNIGVALTSGNPLMAMAGIFQTIEALTRKEEKSRKQISDSVYELKKVGQSGVSSSYGQAQNITVNMSNAIKMDFLIPEGLTANRQEQIAEALVDEIQAKLSSRGYL